jgi:hypothetical protein
VQKNDREEDQLIVQLYLQRLEYTGAISRTEFDQTWAVAIQTFNKSGNWGGVETGVHHHKTYGTAWGSYALIEVDDPAAFARYQTHRMNYGHIGRITLEPVFDLDAELAQRQA